MWCGDDTLRRSSVQQWVRLSSMSFLHKHICRPQGDKEAPACSCSMCVGYLREVAIPYAFLAYLACVSWGLPRDFLS